MGFALPSPPYTPPQGGPWRPPSGDGTPVVHAAPSRLSGATRMLVGVDVLDVSTDRGGGIWAVSPAKVYYFPPGSSTPTTYDQSNGLARGWRTWQDPYFNGTPSSPATLHVTFSAVGGATEGQAIVGNIGAIADRVRVDPRTGALQSVENMAVTTKSTPAGAVDDHGVRVVATHKVIVNLDGPFHGSAYLGGWHGFEAVHGLTADCGCSSDFEEHQHYVPNDDQANGCDSSGKQHGCWDGDVWGLAITPQGDLWAGDRHFAQLLPQGRPDAHLGIGGTNQFKAGVDAFPGVLDENHGLAVDVAGGVWVASDGNGLAYLTPDTWTPMYWSAATTLPLDHLRGTTLDREGDLWVGTNGGGVARYHAPTNHWSYYTTESGLPSDTINTVYLDQFTKTSSRLFIATDNGITVYEAESQLSAAP